MSHTEKPIKENSGSHSDALEGPADAGLLPSGDVIAALASGSSKAAIAVIRITGANCLQILGPCLPKLKTEPGQQRKLQLLSLVDPLDGSVIDEPLVAFFRGPHSFTGEDSVEVYCHGGPYIVRRVLQVIYQLGARAAEPGEFTKRAFLNGKLDLTEAEGIRQLVDAHSEHQWRAARFLAEGQLGQYVEKLRRALIAAMAYLEAGIDFPDEGDTKEVNLTGVQQRVAELDRQLAQLANSYENGRIARTGLKVAIVGAPNMGKSTLMNELLGRERAIVTEVAGTTRDYLEETCLINGRTICLIDTAGLRETEDQVERLGVEKAMALGKEADCVLLLLSATASPEERLQVEQWQSLIGAEKCLRIVTKVDLQQADGVDGQILISCHQKIGLEQLRQALSARVDQSVGSLGDDPYLSSARHLHAVAEARSYIAAFFSGCEDGLYEEMLAFELQNATKALQEIIGSVENDDILEHIFGEFCVGK
ncbi:MAG: tRNA uridine-5-carboxymethylaminomethyl(34) synthesis GTPase MnmE [Oligoflexus sp.]